MQPWITRQAPSESAEQCAVCKYARQSSKLRKMFCMIRDFLELFESSALQVISCLSALTVSLEQHLRGCRDRAGGANVKIVT